MAYIGRDTDKLSNIEKLDTITFDGSQSYTLQKGGVNFTPSSANNLQVSIDGVVQAGNFTVSGSTIDFGVAIPSTSTCDFIFHYGTGLITTPADGTVTTGKIQDGAVTAAKLDSGVALGKVLQVVQSVNTTERTTTSTTFVDVTGLSVNITPSSTSNKILILCNYNGESTTADASSNYTIVRDSTNLANSYFNNIYSSATNSSSPCSICFLDSPSTTSATTYKLQFKRSNSTGGITKVLSLDSTITVMEISA